MVPEAVIAAIEARFPGAASGAAVDGPDLSLTLRPGSLVAVAGFLKDLPHGYRMLLDLTCVDLRGPAGVFEMVYHLCRLERPARIRLKVRLDAVAPEVESLAGLWKNADWLEREVFDMFGVAFRGHPDLKRILMYDGFDGHPLRKDYPLRKRQPRAAGGGGA